MPQMKTTGITDWLKRKGRKIGSFIASPVESIGREMVGISIPKPRTSTTYPRITTGEDSKAKQTTGSRSTWLTSTALYQAANQFILYILILYTVSVMCILLVLMPLLFLVSILVGLPLALFYSVTRWVAGFVSMNSA